jgi:hypothetical protein
MILATRAWACAACVAVLIGGGQLACATAVADDGDLHNITYRARVDGLARGAMITYKINETQVQTADPSMLPGRTFEANAVMADPKQAGMEVSIQWPYSANLHCEILVDDAISAQSDQFIAPRLIRASDDPLYGVLPCGVALSNAGPPAGAPPPTAAT